MLASIVANGAYLVIPSLHHLVSSLSKGRVASWLVTTDVYVHTTSKPITFSQQLHSGSVSTDDTLSCLCSHTQSLIQVQNYQRSNVEHGVWLLLHFSVAAYWGSGQINCTQGKTKIKGLLIK